MAIAVKTLGMLDVAKNNPVIKSESDVANYSFITHEGEVYLVMNERAGDAEIKTIKAGDFLNGFLVKAWEGQHLIVDEAHIAYGEAESYASITAGTTLFTISNGKLAIAESAPADGVYFKAIAKCKYTEKAVEVLVLEADKDTTD